MTYLACPECGHKFKGSVGETQLYTHRLLSEKHRNLLTLKAKGLL